LDIEMSLCDTCAWKDIEMLPGTSKRLLTVEICLYSKPQFPHAKDCDGHLERTETDND
jgi:hypothetical protein